MDTPAASQDALRRAIRDVAAQIDAAAEARFERSVRPRLADPDVEHLARHVNRLLEAASAAIAARAQQASELDRLVTERSAMLQAVFESAIDGLIVSDEHGVVQHSNPAARRLFGYDDLGGRDIKELMPETYRKEHDGYVRHYLDTGEAHIIGSSREAEGLRRDGTTFPVRLALSEAKTGDARRFVALLRDISQEKAQEAALRETKEAAESASLAKSQFLTGMSHELRTPLNAVIGYAELILEDLEDGLPTDGIRSDLEAIRDAGHHLLGLINNVLDLSRIEAGHTELLLEHFDPGDITRAAATTAKPLIEANGNAFSIDIAAGLRPMYNDAGKLRQCLLNLLGNAAKFTTGGTIGLSVRPGRLSDGSQATVWHVSDDGIGIAEDQLERIFDAFTQADGSISRRYGGSGLGLTLTTSLCRMLGGEIGAESELGAGSRFTIALPLRGGAQDSAP